MNILINKKFQYQWAFKFFVKKLEISKRFFKKENNMLGLKFIILKNKADQIMIVHGI